MGFILSNGVSDIQTTLSFRPLHQTQNKRKNLVTRARSYQLDSSDEEKLNENSEQIIPQS